MSLHRFGIFLGIFSLTFLSLQASDRLPAAKKTVVLQSASVPSTDRKMEMGIAEFPPHAAKPRHKATGPEVCYVLAGQVSVKIDEQPAEIFHQGETFQLPANVVHVTTAGPTGAKVLAVWVLTPGKEFNIPVTK